MAAMVNSETVINNCLAKVLPFTVGTDVFDLLCISTDILATAAVRHGRPSAT